MPKVPLRVAAITAAVAALTACTGAAAGDVVAEGPGLCAAAGKTSLVGEAPVTLVRSATTTTSDADAWLGRRDRNGPSRGVADYRELDSSASDAPFAVCVFRSATPRPISIPAEAKIVANGVRILAQAPDRFAVDGIGDVDRLAAKLDSLEAKPE